jgi:hypothetical protein
MILAQDHNLSSQMITIGPRIAPAQLFFIERGCLSKTEIGEKEKEKPA